MSEWEVIAWELTDRITESEGKANGKEGKNRTVIPQSQLPNLPLEKALGVARALYEEFAGKGAEPHQVALALDISPTSSTWRTLSGASVAYGLTEGAYNADTITLTSLGRSAVAPQVEGENASALVEAALRPKIASNFFRKYDKAKLPSNTIGVNVLVGMGLPKDRAEQGFNVLVENGRFTGIITETKTGPFLAIATASKPTEADPSITRISQADTSSKDVDLEEFVRTVAGEPVGPSQADRSDNPQPAKNNKVYISHGKHREIVRQLKDILTFGKYEPVVSVEIETTSIPVPDKVMEDMRSCAAGIINVHSEGEWLDREGNKRVKINDNVLIEIGAAMALYSKRYILLVQKGVALPSNLQGLYRVEYDGDKLDFDTTMKLLRAFNEFDKP